MLKRIKTAVETRGGVKNTVSNISRALQRDGLTLSYYRMSDPELYKTKLYEKWLAANEKPYNIEQVKKEISAFKKTPKISFLIPVYNVGEEYLRICIDSIVNQYYQNWELVLSDDASTEEHVRPILEAYEKSDERIKVVFREKNGHISEATNSALEVATGEFIALVDNDDYIKPEALFEVAKLINKYPNVDMVYTDEDKTNEDGSVRLAPFFKPAWTPDAFWGHMYLCHLGVYRREIALKIGGFRKGYEGAQDYDFALRFTEQTPHIYHVPKILYHWRMLPTSTAASADNKDYAYAASLKSKESALERRGLTAEIEENLMHGSTNVFFKPEATDAVSIIIPTKDHGTDVQKCVQSIYDKTTWSNFEIILVDNGSTDEESLQIFQQLSEEHDNFSVLTLNVPFNYSLLNNKAAKIAKSNFLLFLNNDTEVITEDWLERMLGQARLEKTGAVGAKLFYENKHIQHAGIIALEGTPYHAFHNFSEADGGYFGRLALNYNYLAVTGACLMVEKTKFNEVGGFDEEELPISYNDVDLCLKLYDAGYYNVVRGDVQLFHYESKTRGYDTTTEKVDRLNKERAVLQERWAEKYLNNDPFYNPNLNQEGIDFSLKK